MLIRLGKTVTRLTSLFLRSLSEVQPENSDGVRTMSRSSGLSTPVPRPVGERDKGTNGPNRTPEISLRGTHDTAPEGSEGRVGEGPVG